MIKNFLLFVLSVCFFTAFTIQPSHALTYATGVRVKYSVTGVSTNTWTVLVSSTSKSLKGIMVYNQSVSPMEIGMALSSAAANAETRQILVPPRYNTLIPQAPVFYPISAGYGTRVSLRALESGASEGEGQFTLIYN